MNRKILESVQRNGPISPNVLAYSFDLSVEELDHEMTLWQACGHPVITDEQGRYKIACDATEARAYRDEVLIPEGQLLIQRITGMMLSYGHKTEADNGSG